jgi:GAF domain-containing protein
MYSQGEKRTTGASGSGGLIGIIGVARDITEQKQAEEQHRRTASLLASLNTTKDQFIAEGDTGAAFQSLLHTLISMTGSEYGFLDEVLVDERGDMYKLSLALSDISWDDESRALYREMAARNLEFRKLDNLAGIPVTTGKTVISNDPPHDPRSGGLPHGHPPLLSYMGIPLYFRGELVGVAGVANRPGGYTEELAEWLQPFLSTCAAFIMSVRSQEKERRYVADLQSINGMILATLNASDESAFLIDTNGIILSANQNLRGTAGDDARRHRREKTYSISSRLMSGSREMRKPGK